jgi:DNA adenine methylase
MVTNPAFRLYGGKWLIARWIIEHFPPHAHYVEPCGGAASVLLQKPPSELETYNDLSGDIVNFFRVLRDNPDELIAAIELTPWSRAEYERALKPNKANPVESARRFWCRQQMSIHAGTCGQSRGMRFCKRTAYRVPELKKRERILDSLRSTAVRLRDVQIENRPALEVIQRYAKPDALLYVDPPYPGNLRTEQRRYDLEWTAEDHRRAAELLRASPGYTVLSGYACPLYHDLYEAHGWRRADHPARNNSGNVRMESIWLSPRTVDALNGRCHISGYATGPAKNPAAVALGKLAAGVSKRFSADEIARRSRRLAQARLRRWAKSPVPSPDRIRAPART